MAAINLLPWRAYRRERERNQFLGLLFLCVCGCFATLLIVQATLYRHLQQEKIRLSHLKPTRMQRGLVDQRMGRILLAALKKKNSTQENLHTVLSSLPTQCVLSTLSRQKNQWRIIGFARTTQDVDLFIQALTRSHHFQSIVLADVNKAQHIQFKINCTDAKF